MLRPIELIRLRLPRRRGWLWAALILALLLGGGLAFSIYLRRQPVYDVLIEGGTVFDGQGWIGRRNVGISQGRVVAMGRLWGAKAKQRIDARGKVVSPGFIDTHVHIESSMGIRQPLRAPNFVRMGVTTLVTGNCGNSLEDPAPVLEGIGRNGGQVNLATLVGHKHLRKAILKGEGLGDPTPAQLREMAALLDKEMALGAFGLSTGLEYSPGLLAKAEEIEALTRVVGRRGGIYATHMRNEGVRLREAIDEAISAAKAGGAHLHLSHLKIACQRDWGQMADILSRIDAARPSLKGLTVDAYTYAASSSSFDLLLPEAFRGFRGNRASLVRDQRACRDLAKGMLKLLQDQGFKNYEFAQIVWSRNPAWRGLRLSEVPQDAFKNAPPDTWLSDLTGDPGLRRDLRSAIGFFSEGGGQMIFHVMAERDVETVLADAHCVIGCDSSVRGDDSQTAHPRGCGNAPRLLGVYVRERGVLSLEQALRKLTRQAADIFQLRDRGRIQLQSPADIVIFDAGRIQDRATYTMPLEVPEGIDYVLVNGVVVMDHDRVYNRFPGRVLRHGAGDGAPASRGSGH